MVWITGRGARSLGLIVGRHDEDHKIDEPAKIPSIMFAVIVERCDQVIKEKSSSIVNAHAV